MIPQQPVDGLQTISLTSLALIIIAGIWVLSTSKQSISDSISERLVHNRLQYLVMAALLTVCGGIFYVFGYLWIGPTYHASLGFYITLIVSYIAQVTVAWTAVSGSSNHHTKLHTRGGEIVAISMLLCLLFIFVPNNTHLPFFSYWISLASIVFSLFCISNYAFGKRVRQKFAIYESAYIAFFTASIVMLIAKV